MCFMEDIVLYIELTEMNKTIVVLVQMVFLRMTGESESTNRQTMEETIKFHKRNSLPRIHADNDGK